MRRTDVNFILRILRWILSGISIGMGVSDRANRSSSRTRRRSSRRDD